MELACGFGATVFLVVVLIVVYHVYWLEMVLFYRAHFGTDETILGEYWKYDANLFKQCVSLAYEPLYLIRSSLILALTSKNLSSMPCSPFLMEIWFSLD